MESKGGKFREKPVVIEAEQWFPGKKMKGIQGDNPTKLCGCIMLGYDGSKPHVHTIHEGQGIFIKPGDWIIPEKDGKHFYPITNEMFEINYEPFDESLPPSGRGDESKLYEALRSIAEYEYDPLTSGTSAMIINHFEQIAKAALSLYENKINKTDNV